MCFHERQPLRRDACFAIEPVEQHLLAVEPGQCDARGPAVRIDTGCDRIGARCTRHREVGALEDKGNRAFRAHVAIAIG